jgi:eukaryotic-like serine/threonine-protein kinase
MSEAPSLVCPLCQATYEETSLEYCRLDGARLRPLAVLGQRWRGKLLDGRYEVLRYLGAGGMAEVYEATRLADDQRVALKLMRPQVSEDPSMVERFKLEAQLITLIDHPNVIQVFDFGRFEEGTLFIAMELLRGEPLDLLLERGPIDLAIALDVATQACEGLHAAHEKGIVHRDVKPANIFLQRRGEQPPDVTVKVKILDLGIAKLNADRSSNLTATGMVFGSPEYMSPEQALGKPVDPRSDIYGFGVVLFHAFTGRVPFFADSFVGVLTKHVTTAPHWPHEVAAERGLPPAAGEVIMKALAKNPDHRQQSMLELRDELNEACHGVDRGAPAAELSTAGTVALRTAPTGVQRVTLSGSGADLDGEVVEIAPDVFWVGRREGVLLERNIYLRVYRGNGLQLNVLIDPGPTKDLSTVAAKVKPIIGPLEKIDLIFLNHQDPDVAGNAPVIQELNPRAHVICSEDTWRLAHFYGLRPRSFSATEHFKGMRTNLATGHTVSFVPSPYCHFRGAVMYYDETSKILFSGDLFGGLSSTLELVAGNAALAGIEFFHQLYMPSRRALRGAVERVRCLDPKPLAIAPQHGGIIGGEQLEPVLDLVAGLEVGADLFDPGKEMGRYVAATNAIVEALVQRVGEAQVAATLRCFSADGTFPNLFIFEGDLSVVEIKIEPRAAIKALLVRTVKLLERGARAAFEQEAAQLLADHNVTLASEIDTVFEPYAYKDFELG